MKISVAMTVYNGERYLEKQLDSIRKQNVAIDELIACDDGSTDKSPVIFRNYILSNGLQDKWTYRRNELNKGYIRNFIDCALQCNGDIVFFADQDDVWEPDKISNMINIFNTHPDAMVVCCSISCIDENDKSCDTLLTKHRIGHGNVEKVPFEKQVVSMRSSGLTLAVRRECLVPTFDIIQKYSLQYDSPFGLFYSIKGQFYRIYKPLVRHRVHATNASVPSYTFSSRKLDRHIKGREIQCRTLEIALERFGDELTDVQKKHLEKEIIYRKKAINALKERNTLELFGQLFRWGKMDNKAIDISNFRLAFREKLRGDNI